MLIVKLTAAFTPNPLTAPVLDGNVVPNGIAWTPQAVGPGDLFFRQLKYREFDVSELSMSSLTIGISQGDRTWAALPIFTTRAFYHTDIIVREDSRMTSPSDLRGGRVGVLEYQQTSVVWIRGILENEFGVRATDVEWFMERSPEQSHGGTTGFAPPPGVRLSYVRKETSLAAMLAAGTIDAILFHPVEIDGLDQRQDGARARLKSRPLFPDPAAEARRYFAKTGIVPVNHSVVVRRSILDEHPSIAAGIYEAFDRGHDGSIAPYGIEANRVALETLMQYLADQRLTKYRVALDEVFAEPSFRS
jgi:4,5-dihydroxyphthalate decarboxylase